MRKTYSYGPLPDLSNPCYTDEDSSCIMYTTSSEVLEKTVGDLLHVDINIIMARLNSILGTGAVYSFDPVGSYERETCRAAGERSRCYSHSLTTRYVIIFTTSVDGLKAKVKLR
jgi:20S proteasome alpha/beta subunit